MHTYLYTYIYKHRQTHTHTRPHIYAYKLFTPLQISSHTHIIFTMINVMHTVFYNHIHLQSCTHRTLQIVVTYSLKIHEYTCTHATRTRQYFALDFTISPYQSRSTYTFNCIALHWATLGYIVFYMSRTTPHVLKHPSIHPSIRRSVHPARHPSIHPSIIFDIAQIHNTQVQKTRGVLPTAHC